MHETERDLSELAELLDRSHAAGGAHLRSVFTDERRIRARELCELLSGVRVLNVATVTAACEPRVAPVDGLFFRGRFWFGSSHDSLRFRHLRARPQVSASHVDGERLAVVMHGHAREQDLESPAAAEFREYCLEVYGDGWLEWGARSPYARIEPVRMFTMRSGSD